MSDLRLPDLNKVLLAGRLTRDPELKYTQAGRAYCRAGIATTRYFKGADGERKEDTTFVDVVLWDRIAEYVGERLRKGRPVLVEGRLKSDAWEDKATGQKRTKLEILAQRMMPLDWEDGEQKGPAKRESAPRQQSKQREIEEEVPEDDLPF